MKKVAAELEIAQSTVTNVLNKSIEVIKDTVVNGGEVGFENFGTFKKVIQKEKVARNLKTNEPLIIPEREAVKFKASHGFLGTK